MPNFYQHKPDTHAKAISGYTPRDYLTHWLSQWVRDYGIDGFRVDTAKHIGFTAATAERPGKPGAGRVESRKPGQKTRQRAILDDRGILGHGVMQSDYYRHGFDAMINFDYQEQRQKRWIAWPTWT